MTSILINEPDGFPLEAIERLRRIGSVYRSDDCYPHEAIDAAFVRLREFIGREFHLKHPSLKYLISPTTGLNHLDIAHFEKSGVNVITLKGRTDFLEHIHATAEHTLALALSLIRKIPWAVNSVYRGEWNRYPFKGTELYGKNVLVFGYGRIGRQVHALYEAFGCNVLAHDVDLNKVPKDLRCTLRSALETTDILSLHVSLDSTTRGIISDAILDDLPPHAIIINTSRGEIIDQHSMLLRISAGRIAGAALDVLADEPLPLSDVIIELIRKCDSRLLITPHIAGFTEESLKMVENHVVDVAIMAIKNGPCV